MTAQKETAPQPATTEQSSENRRPLLLVAAIAVILAGVAIAWLSSDIRTKKSAELRAETILLDSAVEQTYTLTAMIDGQYRLLGSLSEYFAEQCGTDPAGITEMLSTVSAKTGFSYIRYIDAKGVMYVNDGTANVWGRNYFQDAINGSNGMQYVMIHGLDMPAVALSAPYRVKGNIEGVLCGWMNKEDLQRLLMPKAYGGSSYSLLVNSSGTALIFSESAYLVPQKGSLSYLEHAQFDDGMTFQHVIARMKSGESFTFRCTVEGIRRVVAVASMSDKGLPENDWFVVNAVSQEFLDKESAVERRNSLEIMYIVMGFAAVAVALLLMYRQRNVRALTKNAEEIRQREECFRIAASQTGRFVFRYDITTRTYYHITGYDGPFRQELVQRDLVEKMIAKGAIAPESAQAYREFFRAIDAGETPPDTDVRLIKQGGGASWYRFSATLVFSSIGRATTAVVSYVECDEQREREMAYSRWRQEMEKLSNKNTVLLEWNITKNIFESERGDARVSPSAYAHATFDEVAEIYAEGNIVSDDRQAYLSVVNREHLLGMYHSGRTGAELDYRETRSDGAYHWMRLNVHLVMYPTSTDIKAYVAAMDVDEEKRAELTLIAKSEIDPLTGAYNRGAFIDRVTNLLIKHPDRTHALMMLDIDEFKSVNDTLGHDFGDRLLQSIPATARRLLRTGDMIGRIGGDEFMICLADTAEGDALTKKLQELLNAFSQNVSGERTVTVSMGAAVFPRDGASFEELYKKADIAMYCTKKSGKNNFCFYAEGMGTCGNVPTRIDK